MSIKPGTICPMRDFVIHLGDTRLSIKAPMGKRRHIFIYVGTEEPHQHVDVDAALASIGYIAPGSPVAHAEKGVLNWLDGRRIEEDGERFLYAGPKP